ncbi:MAG TPA: response regulator [Kofleriaceae bacterium]|jgi:two-component system chemotaxis sensor kinase CheA
MASDPYKYFRIEAHELVGELAKGVLELEKHADAELVARLLRHAHTLKGAARIVKHRELADLAHALEDALEPLRAAPIAKRHDAALAIVDGMHAQLAALEAPAAPVAATSRDDLPALPRADTSAIDEALAGLAQVHALVERARAGGDAQPTSRVLEQADRAIREVRRDIEQLRLSRAGALFTPLERVARDAALVAGKRVAFTGTGDAVRVDADVLAAVHPALVQLVRNAVVHGIETPQERARLGKPQEGRIAITVASRGLRIAITCEDDGAGLDVAAIARAAERRGLAREVSDEPARLFELILRGGISTSVRVDELSGRGIGLDVVRDAAQRLRGEVSATTHPGRGTSISLLLPISATSIAVLAVVAGERRAVIPQTSIRRVARVRERDLTSSADGLAIALDDTMVPCAPLAELLRGARSRGDTAVFVGDGERVAAVTVDRVIGVEEVVVRPLPGDVPIDPIVWGLALDAAGRPCPVLDAGALIAAARKVRFVAEPTAPRLAPILVVDDSLTTRMLEQSILESAGFEVDVATSAEEALDRLERRTYSLVLVDVEMPGMDGFTMVATMRSRPDLAKLPAILVTSRDAPIDRKRGADAGAQGYVVKSTFDQAKLVAMIHELVQR